MSPARLLYSFRGDAGQGWSAARAARSRPPRNRGRACTERGATTQVMDDLSSSIKKGATP